MMVANDHIGNGLHPYMAVLHHGSDSIPCLFKNSNLGQLPSAQPG